MGIVCCFPFPAHSNSATIFHKIHPLPSDSVNPKLLFSEMEFHQRFSPTCFRIFDHQGVCVCVCLGRVEPGGKHLCQLLQSHRKDWFVSLALLDSFRWAVSAFDFDWQESFLSFAKKWNRKDWCDLGPGWRIQSVGLWIEMIEKKNREV